MSGGLVIAFGEVNGVVVPGTSTIDHLETDVQHKSGKSATQVVLLIVMMNLIFSFDSVLSAIAITDVFPILAAAILLSGLAMLLLADGVTAFLEKNRMY